MKEVTKKTEYESNDGMTFDNAAAAKRYEEFAEAIQAYEDAKRTLGQVLAERCKTADGKTFSFGLWSKYYWITPGYFALPRLLECEFWGTNWSWDDSHNINDIRETDPEICLLSYQDHNGGKMDHGQAIPISELYDDRAAVDAALKIAQRKWLIEKAEELGTDTQAAEAGKGE
jgi:hypothetical protein